MSISGKMDKKVKTSQVTTDRLYLAKYNARLKNYGIKEPARDFIDRAFHKLLNETLEARTGGSHV